MGKGSASTGEKCHFLLMLSKEYVPHSQPDPVPTAPLVILRIQKAMLYVGSLPGTDEK